jgi:cell division GTPase FtsZ
VVAGLGGGTGGGAGSVVIDQLQSICDVPVYAVGVLPSESEGSRPALTAARSLQSFVDRADNVVLFDNDAWIADDVWDTPPTTTDRSGDEGADDDADGDEDVDDDADGRVMDAYGQANAVLADQLVALFGAGGVDGTVSSETQLDPSDIMRMLDTGGVSSIGSASIDLPRNGGVQGWLRALRDLLPWTDGAADEEEATDAARINSLVRRAARSKLTVSCEISSADRALIVLSGPPGTLSRKGFESGRYWLEQEADVVDVMAGDEPHDGSATLTGVVLFSNVTDVPRIDAMQEAALEHHQSTSTAASTATTAAADEWQFDTTQPS